MEHEPLKELIEMSENEVNFTYNVDEKLRAVSELENLGFTKVAAEKKSELENQSKVNKLSKQGYIKITDGNIKKFLIMKVEKYNKSHKPYKNETIRDIVPSPYLNMEERAEERRRVGRITRETTGSYGYPSVEPRRGGDSLQKYNPNIHKITNDYYSRKPGTIGQFCWAEHEISDYPTIPPKHVLDRLKEEKEKNLFDYFTIGSVEELPDPILFGRLFYNKDRYFIAQWGTDITLDDLI